MEQKHVVITRVFDAPREKVWNAWTTPEGLMKWWGPKGFTSPECKMDFTVGGKYLWCMEGHIPGFERKMYSTGIFKEIIPMEKIVYTDNFADENGNVVSAAHYGMDGNISEMEVTVTLEDEGSKTKMTVVSKFSGMSDEDMKNMDQGWNESFDKLNESIK